MSPHAEAVEHDEGVDSAIPWHYGDPFGEQRQLVGAVGVIDRGNRDMLTVTGIDRLPWLHSICSQHVADLPDGASAESLVLSPHGHVEQQWQLTELDETVWIDTEPGAGPQVLNYLQTMRFMKRVEPADVSMDWAVVSLRGPLTDQVLAAAALPISPPPAPARAISLPSGGFVRPMPRGADLIVPRATSTAMIDRLRAAGAQPVGMWALEAIRVQARVARLGFETDHRTIPHEVGWIGSAVHLAKGCYRGQETVARVQNLGKPPRRLVLLHLSGDSDALPTPGTSVESAGRSVGFLGTAVHHYELGPIALAVIKRTTPDDAELVVGGSAAAIDASPSV
ncbi:MAG: folate-binding protein [Actinomycetota bacterium]|nr:folate-binding protein [Actinomycetota bacterium]